MQKHKKLLSFVVILAMLITTVSLQQINRHVTAEAATTYNDYSQDQIVAAMGAGWNLGNQLEANINGVPSETCWGNPVITEDLILAVKEQGFKSIRIPVSYLDKIGEAPSYKIDSAWLDRVQQVVDMCVSNGLYAIINIHGDGYNTIDHAWFLCNGKDQATIKAKYEAVWKQIATRFADYDEHLIFESMNEEFDNTWGTPDRTYYSNINDYNQIFLDTIRRAGGNNDKRWVLIPGWNTTIDYTVGDNGFVMPTDKYLSSECTGKRIMISAHYYEPWDFCGLESGAVTQWGPDAKDQYRTASWGDEAHMKTQMKKMHDAFVVNGYPVVIGEYGAINKSADDPTSNTYREAFCNTLCTYCKQYGMIPVYWDNGYNGNYGFALFDRATCEITQKGIINSIMDVYGNGENNTSTAITLGQSEMTIYVGDEKKTITATLTPADSKDKITWTSSDESVASVNPKGQVTAIAVGKATITATANGHSATCEVTVPKNECVRAKFNLLETKGWKTITSEKFVDIPKEGGSFTLSLKASRTDLENIGSLYIKDITCVDGSASVFDSAKVKVDSVVVNDVKYGMKEDTFTYDRTAKDVKVPTTVTSFDFPVINVWGTTFVENVSYNNDTKQAFFNGIGLQDTNTVTINFKVFDVNGGTVTPVTEAPTTEPPVTEPPVTEAPPTDGPVTTPPTTPPVGNKVEASVAMTNEWPGGGLGEITIKNTTGKSFTDGWTLEFDLDREIEDTWSGTLVSHEGNHYVITNPDWNKEFKAGDTYTVNFKAAEGAAKPSITNAKLY